MRKIIDFLIGLGSEEGQKNEPETTPKKGGQQENGKSVKTNNTVWF